MKGTVVSYKVDANRKIILQPTHKSVVENDRLKKISCM